MAKDFDAATKELLEADPGPWMAYLGLTPDGPVRVVDSDLSTISAAADKVFQVDGPEPYLIHLEMQSTVDRTLARRLWRYNALLDLKHDLRARSVAVLLRREVDTGDLTGVLDLRLPDSDRIVEFHYRVVRAWEQPVEPILAGGLGILPMAPLADVPRRDVPKVLRRIDARLSRETQPARAAIIMEAALVLAGMRLEEEELEELRRGLQTMNITTESSYYRLAVKEGRQQGRQEGRIEGARALILRQGQARFGPPDEPTRTAIEAINDLERLERLSDRVLTATTWAELLAEP